MGPIAEQERREPHKRDRLGGAYASGRCRNWLKVKNPAFERR
jgi:hypothetical protein